MNLIQKAGYQIGNIDSTICLEFPKIKPHAAKMQKVIADILEIEKKMFL